MSRTIPQHESAMAISAQTRVGDTLVRVAAEIDLAAETAADLQAALSPILAQSGTILASQKIQGLDLLEQTLRDLSTVLGEIASTQAGSAPLDATSVVARCKLASVARRLSGAAPDMQQDDLELF